MFDEGKRSLILSSRQNNRVWCRTLSCSYFLENKQPKKDADDSAERVEMKHPRSPISIVHPTVERGHVDDWKGSERREQGVLGGSSCASNSNQEHSRESGITKPLHECIGEDTGSERVRRSCYDGHSTRNKRYGSAGSEVRPPNSDAIRHPSTGNTAYSTDQPIQNPTDKGYAVWPCLPVWRDCRPDITHANSADR